MALGPGLFANASNGKVPKRFVFVHKGNGLLPDSLIPPTLAAAEKQKEKNKEAFEVNLGDHDLPSWMGALNEHKAEMTILQGLSGKMCTTGHHTWQSSLGVYKANERLSSIKWATVDFELAKLFPSSLEHIELACFPSGGGNSRGNINGIEKGFRHAVLSNRTTLSVRPSRDGRAFQVCLKRQRRADCLQAGATSEFAAKNEGAMAEELRGLEKAKVKNYSDSIEDIRERNRKMDAMADVIRKHAPKLDAKYLSDDINTIDRQLGHTEILLSTLISGMTNVVTFTVDELGTPYTGITDIEKEIVNLHDVGHGKPVKTFQALEVREKVRRHHMDVLDRIVTRLKSVPEDGGTMFDNTMVLYFPDNGETHHSHGTEWPFIVLSGKNAKMDIAGKYIRLPHYGKEGHKTLGNWYTSILNAYGNPVEHYGAIDTGLTHMDQKGAIKQFIG